MASVNYDTELLDQKGKPIVDNGKNLTLGDVVGHGLLAITESDKNMSPPDKLRSFKIAMKAEGTQELSVSDIAFIIKRLGTILTPLLLGRVYEILDPDSLKKGD